MPFNVRSNNFEPNITNCSLVKKSIFILLFVLLYASKAIAVSAFPGPITMTQPDGNKITVYQKGDEHFHWVESMDGHVLKKNSSGYLTYATLDSNGNLVASDIIAQEVSQRSSKAQSFLATQTTKTFYSLSQIDSLVKRTSTASTLKSNIAALPTGTKKVLVILMGYADLAFSKTATEFNDQFNSSGYSSNTNQSSVKEYFAANSYGNFVYSFDVMGPYTASRNMAYYGADSGSEGNDQHPDSLVEEAIRAVHSANSSFDFSQYVAINVIFAGNGQEAGASSNAIWSHQADFTPPSYCSITHYLETPELYLTTSSTMNTIGVTCHELTHVIGAPDYYDTDYTSGGGEFIGTGEWDLMAEGNWNRANSSALYGSCPANMTMYQKICFNWVKPIVLDTTITISNMADNGTKGIAYKITTNTQGEYFILENRQQSGYDTGLPGHGLMIYHIAKYGDDVFYDLNITAPQMVYPVCASSTYSTPSSTVASYGSIDSGGCPFPGTYSKTSFTDSTTPSAQTWNGTNNLKSITDITESNGTISFNFMKDQAAAPTPLNLTSKTSSSGLVLSWTKPSSIPLLADTIVEQHWDGRSLDASLTVNSKITWTCGQVYSADSLVKYVGKKWNGVKFFPTDGSASSYYIELYKVNSVSYTNETLSLTQLLSQSVSSVTSDEWNEFTFSSPVTIQANTNYAVAVKCTSPSGYTPSIDRGPQTYTTSNNNFGAFYSSGSYYYLLTSSLNYNFNVRGMINLGHPIRYNVYFNGDSIGYTTSLTYTVSSPQTGAYCVKMVNNEVKGESACLDYTSDATSPLIYNYDKSSGNLIPVQILGFNYGTKVYIYTAVGRLYKEFTYTGATSVTLPSGVWVIKAGSYIKKITVN